MQASLAPRPASTPRRSRGITSAEMRAALTWAFGYEAVVLGAGIGIRLLLMSLRAGVLLGVFDRLLTVLLLPASLISLMFASALDGWRSLVGLLGLNIVTAAGVALWFVHRRHVRE